ncbi:MAG: methyltransferase domain-containing protein [Caldilineaceae bacterium]
MYDHTLPVHTSPRPSQSVAVKEHTAHQDNIYGAFAFNYAPRQLNRYYQQWAHTYDIDVYTEHYTGPAYLAAYLANFTTEEELSIDVCDPYLEIIDAGCGTGLVGMALTDHGYRQIDGFDLSEAMVTEAQKLGIYRKLIAGCNMLQPIPHYQKNQYEICVCCGVFTKGHVPPTALTELVRITQPGGLVVVSTRKSYYETTPFKPTYEAMVRAGLIKLIDAVMDGPYLAEEGAHYWIFKVL